MRVAPRANLTIALLRQAAYGTDRLLGVCSKPLHELSIDVETRCPGRVDIVELGQAPAQAELLGYPHTTTAPVPTHGVETPSPIDGPTRDDAPLAKDDPPPTRPNPGYEPADGRGIGLIDLLA